VPVATTQRIEDFTGQSTAEQTDNIARLTTTDISNLRFETPEAPTHIGALLLIEATALFDSTGQLQLDGIRRRLELRLARVPALRRRLFQPGLFRGRPVWVDDEAFDIRNHIRTVPLPPGAGDAELLQALHRSRGIPGAPAPLDMT
jgi:diacylglycerol O-acyltransferase